MIYIAIIAIALQQSPTADEDSPHGTLTFNIVDSGGNHIPSRLTFTDEEVEMMLDTNAKRLFKLEATPDEYAVKYKYGWRYRTPSPNRP